MKSKTFFLKMPEQKIATNHYQLKPYANAAAQIIEVQGYYIDSLNPFWAVYRDFYPKYNIISGKYVKRFVDSWVIDTINSNNFLQQSILSTTPALFFDTLREARNAFGFVISEFLHNDATMLVAENALQFLIRKRYIKD